MILEDSRYTALKKHIEKYCLLQEGEWAYIASKWKPRDYGKGEYILKAGQVENYFYFVHRGVMRLFADKDDQEVNAGFTYNGDFSGVYDSFLAQQPADLYLQAIAPCECLRIHYDDMMELYDAYKSMERFGRLFHADMLLLMARRQIEARSYSAEERFQRLLDHSPHIFQLVPQKYLASYLGMTPETFSRLRKKLTPRS